MRVMALSACLWDWNEAHLRVGEPYMPRSLSKPTLYFTFFKWIQQKSWSPSLGVGEHADCSTVRISYGRKEERVPIGLCIAAVMLYQLLSQMSRTAREGLSSEGLLSLAVHVPKVLKSCAAAVGQPIEDPIASCELLQRLLMDLGREEEDEATLAFPGVFTFHGAPDEASVNLVATSLAKLLL